MKEMTLGEKIRIKKSAAPFSDLTMEAKINFSQIVCKDPNLREQYKICLTDYILTNSKIEKEIQKEIYTDTNGNTTYKEVEVPKHCAILRFKRILRTIFDGDKYTYIFMKKDFKTNTVTETTDYAEATDFYSYTGSEVLYDMLSREIPKDLLPSITVIQEFKINNKTFYKFT